MRKSFSRYLAVAALPVLVTLTLTGCGQATANNGASSNGTGNAAVSGSTTGSSVVSDSTVVATYNGGSVTEGELNKYLGVLHLVNPSVDTSSNSAKTSILQQYITLDKVLAQKASAAGFTVDSKTVSNDVAQFKSQMVQQVFSNSTQSYNQKLQSMNLTDADFTQLVGDEFAVEAYAKSLIPASDLQTYYNQNLTDFTVTTQHGILVKTQATANKVYTLLVADHSDANWNKLAKQYSQDPGSKDNGGVYADKPANKWVPGYAKAVTTQPIGQVGKPFKTSYGWFVVEVTKRSIEPFSSVKSQVATQMVSDASSKYSMGALLTRTEKPLNIKVMLPQSSTPSTNSTSNPFPNSASNSSN